MEHSLVLAVADLSEGDKLPLDRESLVEEQFEGIVKRWREADKKIIICCLRRRSPTASPKRWAASCSTVRKPAV